MKRMRTMPHLIENINRVIKKNHTEITELKNTITEMKSESEYLRYQNNNNIIIIYQNIINNNNNIKIFESEK